MAYYATAEQSGRRAILAGPYRTHGAALAASARCRRINLARYRDVDPFAITFGTAHDRAGKLRRRGIVGKLNSAVGYSGMGARP